MVISTAVSVSITVPKTFVKSKRLDTKEKRLLVLPSDATYTNSCLADTIFIDNTKTSTPYPVIAFTTTLE